MLSLADILAKKLSSTSTKIVSERAANRYQPASSSAAANIRTKARTYTLIHDYLQLRFSHHAFTFFIKYPKKDCIVIDFQSANNSLVASLNLNKVGLVSQFHEILCKEDLIAQDSQIIINLKLG